jgi:hypothetical protein
MDVPLVEYKTGKTLMNRRAAENDISIAVVLTTLSRVKTNAKLLSRDVPDG